MSAGNNDLWSLSRALNLNDKGFHAVMILINLTGNLLIGSQHSLYLTQIDIHIFVFLTLDDAGNNVLIAALEALINLSTLGLTNALYHNLLSILSSNTTKVFRSYLSLYNIACQITRINSLRLLHSHFSLVNGHTLNYSALCIYMNFTGFLIHIHSNILVSVGIFLISSNQSVFNSLVQKLGLNTLLLSQFLNG